MLDTTKSHYQGGLRKSNRLVIELTTNETDIKQSQRLRHRIFLAKDYEGYGSSALDADHFDAYYFHLIVRDYSTREVIASTRILTDQMDRLAGGFYSETEFQIDNILALKGRIMEIGRTCVHPHYRDGAAISLLWKGPSRFMVLNKIDYMIGCASIGMEDGGNEVRRIMDSQRDDHMTEGSLRVEPRCALPALDTMKDENPLIMPPLLKSYMKLGVKIFGEPCWDEAYNVADVFVMLDNNEIAPRYARRFTQQYKTQMATTRQ